MRASERVVVDGDGVRISVLHVPGDGPSLVLLPGITTTATSCTFVASRLAERYDVYVVDQRGRGASGRASAGHYRLDDYAADLDAVIIGLGLHEPVLLGHSLGARVVARWAAGRAEHGPLVLVDPPLSGPDRPYPMTWSSFHDQLAQAYAGTTAEAVRAYFPGWPAAELALRVAELPTCDEVAVRETHQDFESDEFEPDWRRLTAPVCLIHGGSSAVVLPADVDRLSAELPGATLRSVAGAGHMVPWDDLEGFLAAVTDVVSQPQRTGETHD